MTQVKLYNDQITLIHGDCLEELPKLNVKCQMVFADLPYGTTQNKWDIIIPFDKLWIALGNIFVSTSNLVFTGSQPFTTLLVASNLNLFKYEWIWEKSKATGNALADKRPMKAHENVLVFYEKFKTYNPQKTQGKPYKPTYGLEDEVYHIGPNKRGSEDGTRFPRSVQHFKDAYYSTGGSKHKNQKPVALLEYLIKTYTNEGDLVIDPTMGSGTTGVACKNLNRRFIGIEKDYKIFCTAVERCSVE